MSDRTAESPRKGFHEEEDESSPERAPARRPTPRRAAASLIARSRYVATRRAPAAAMASAAGSEDEDVANAANSLGGRGSDSDSADEEMDEIASNNDDVEPGNDSMSSDSQNNNFSSRKKPEVLGRTTPQRAIYAKRASVTPAASSVVKSIVESDSDVSDVDAYRGKAQHSSSSNDENNISDDEDDNGNEMDEEDDEIASIASVDRPAQPRRRAEAANAVRAMGISLRRRPSEKQAMPASDDSDASISVSSSGSKVRDEEDSDDSDDSEDSEEDDGLEEDLTKHRSSRLAQRQRCSAKLSTSGPSSAVLAKSGSPLASSTVAAISSSARGGRGGRGKGFRGGRGGSRGGRGVRGTGGIRGGRGRSGRGYSVSAAKPPPAPGRRGPARATKKVDNVGDSSDEDDFLVTDDEENAHAPSASSRDQRISSPADSLDLEVGPNAHVMEKILAQRAKLKSPCSITALPSAGEALKMEKSDTDDDGGRKSGSAENNGLAKDLNLKPKSNSSLEHSSEHMRSTSNAKESGSADVCKVAASSANELSSALKRDKDSESAEDDAGADGPFEYLVKWKDFAYIHCQWVDEDVVLRQSQGKSRLQRFQRKQEIASLQRADGMADDAEDAIPEDFVTVDRVLAERTQDGVTSYYVKWRSLSYAEATWELAEDLKDDAKIDEFHKKNEKPPPRLLTTPPRPKPSTFRTLPMPKFKNDGELRPYQMEGFNWLVSCWYNQQGCILADEMGLGKTIQSVSFLNHLFAEEDVRGPFLVLAPLSTLGHWQREFESWTCMNAIVYHGNSESRAVMWEYEWSYGPPSKHPPFKWHVLITTYETILQDANRLRQIEWNAIVVDEAHRLKNRASRLVDELKMFKSGHRVLLTGTPIQNNSLEVWALLNYLEPAKFASEEEFTLQFGNITNADTVERLKALLRPYLLRRLKEDVEKSIPPKEETIISVELTRVQKKWYRGMLEQNFSFLSKGAKSSNVGNLRNIVMELRKCCNHPYLIKGVEQIETEHIVSGDDAALMRHLVEASGKMVLVDKLLPELKKKGHRVLIFSQMIRVLDILEDYLLAHRWGYERIDGRVRGNDRQQAIDRFSRGDSDKFVFLLCTRAGGQGINLTVADTVIIYDSDWNPQNDVQAQARCHRIGQKTEVKVYRLITRATYEQDMFDRASKKLGLDQAILQNMGANSDLGSLAPTGEVSSSQKKNANILNDMNRKDIDSLLRKGAYDVFNEDDTAADAFTSEDIHQILSKRSAVLRTTAADAGPSEFSKASFAAKATFAAEEADEKGDVELDDPDFWQKLMPEASEAPDPNIEALPRRRRQTVRYMPGADSDDSELEDDDSGDEANAKLGPSGKRIFNKGERQRVQRALMTLGWGRWEEIQELAGPPVTLRRSLDDVAVFCRNIVHMCWHYVLSTMDEDEEDAKVQERVKELKSRLPFLEHALAPHRVILPGSDDGDSDTLIDEFGNRLGTMIHDGDVFIEPVLQSEEYSHYIQRNANHIFDRLQLMWEIRTLYESNALAEDCQIPVVGASGSQAIGEWWDSSFDRDLIRGTAKYGYGSYTAMRKDSDLVFLGRVEPLPKELGSNRVSTGDQSMGKDLDSSGSDSPNAENCSLSKKAIDENSFDTGDEKIGSSPNKVSSDAVVRDTESEGFLSAAFIPQVELLARKWPLVQVLNIRVRKLVRGFVRMRKKADRQAKVDIEIERQRIAKEERRLAREAQKEEHALERERRVAVANRVWSKKEKADFSKYYSVVGAPPLDNDGLPSWELVKSRAGLTRKSADAVEAYAKEYCEMCELVLAADAYNRQHGGNLIDYLLHTKDCRYSAQDLDDARVTVLTAKKWIERKQLLEKLREVLREHDQESVRDRISEYGGKAGRERLPVWWESNRLAVDIGLLQGIATHGFDAMQTALDHSLPFRRSLSESVIQYIKEQLAEQEREGIDLNDDIQIPSCANDVAEADILKFYPKDKIILSRTKRLVDIVLQPFAEEHDSDDDIEDSAQNRGKEPTSSRLHGQSRASSVGDGRGIVKDDRPGKVKDTYTNGVLKTKTSGTGSFMIADGVYAGEIDRSFEQAPSCRMTRKLLRFLKHQKKMHANRTLELSLPDWTIDPTEFRNSSHGHGDDMNCENSDSQPSRPAKRRRTSALTQSDGTKVERVKESHMYKITRDEEGDVVYPIRLGVLTIEALGKVDASRPMFHTDRTIYPVGYKALREYTSMVNVERTCKYVCEILDGGDDAPVFRVICMDQPDVHHTSSSPSGCWTNVLTAVRDATPADRKRLHTNVSGPEYFGLTNSLVQELVQELPDSELCSKYVRITFVASSKRQHGRGGRSLAGKSKPGHQRVSENAVVDSAADSDAGEVSRDGNFSQDRAGSSDEDVNVADPRKPHSKLQKELQKRESDLDQSDVEADGENHKLNMPKKSSLDREQFVKQPEVSLEDVDMDYDDGTD